MVLGASCFLDLILEVGETRPSRFFNSLQAFRPENSGISAELNFLPGERSVSLHFPMVWQVWKSKYEAERSWEILFRNWCRLNLKSIAWVENVRYERPMV